MIWSRAKSGRTYHIREGKDWQDAGGHEGASLCGLEPVHWAGWSTERPKMGPYCSRCVVKAWERPL